MVRETRNRRILVALVVFAILFCAWGTVMDRAYAQQDGQVEKIRVGYFAFDGYHMIDDYGNRSGYGYDYLQYLARYTDFTYEYVGYDRSWNEMQDMLENGQIDILSSARKTKERLNRFDFSEQPVGSSSAILTVKAGDNRYMVNDYTKLTGIRIGLLEGNSRNEDLEQFARKNHFTYEPVYFEDGDVLQEELQKGGSIDAVLTSNLRKIENEWTVATFNTTPFYIMVKKGNQELLDEINYAARRLMDDHPDLTSTLFERYYAADSGNEIPYTPEERQYIKEWQNGGKNLKVTVNSEREPVSYFVDGNAKGIIPEIAKEVLDRTGIPYELVDTPPEVDARDLLEEGKAMVRFDGIADFNDAEARGLRVTDAYLELPLSSVTLKGFSGKPKSVAVIRNSDVVEEYVGQIYDSADIVRYNSTGECLDAVLKGEQDAAFLQTYIAQRLVNEDVTNRFKEQLVPGYEMNFAVSVKQSNTLLFTILDKAVLSIGTKEINRIVLEQTSYLSREMSLVGYLYQHPVLSLFLLAVAACFVIIIILYISRQKNLRLEREKSQGFERFISYVCKANNNVMEVEPETRIYRSYSVKNGKIACIKQEIGDDGLRIYSIHPEDERKVDGLVKAEEITRLIETGGEVYFEARVKEEARYQWFAFTFQGVPRDERTLGSLMIFMKNIDQAKREEEEKRLALQDALTSAQQAGKARGAFMSRMSHEIRTPLNAIIGYMTIARSNLLSIDKIEDCLGKAEFAAHHLLSIVNDVLDISAIESGKMQIAHEAFNIRELLSGITAIYRTQAEEKGIKFKVRLQDLTEESLLGDQLRLNQILLNLLSNAVKFTPAGKQVDFRIVQKSVAKGIAYLQFEIEDSGIGMSEEFKKRLFQPFEQQDASTALKFGGTGLGLSITKNLVSMMNGTIDVKSEEGCGTIFTVNLSFDIADTAADPKPFSLDFSNLDMLVIYDRESDYSGIAKLLERFGIRYDMTLCMQEAVKKLEEKQNAGEEYMLCLIDWDIPDAGGERAAKLVRSAYGSKGPVILAAAYEAPERTKGDCLVDEIILKPIFQSSMYDVLSNICRCQTRKCDTVSRTTSRLNGVRILMAEDNPLNMDIATEILTENGVIVDGVENGLKALERFAQSDAGAYQAILLDIQMPVMNGYEAAEHIRSCGHPQSEAIPIIALSADAFEEDVNHALASGMNSHVSKPIEFDQLLKILTAYIS